MQGNKANENGEERHEKSPTGEVKQAGGAEGQESKEAVKTEEKD